MTTTEIWKQLTEAENNIAEMLNSDPNNAMLNIAFAHVQKALTAIAFTVNPDDLDQ